MPRIVYLVEYNNKIGEATLANHGGTPSKCMRIIVSLRARLCVGLLYMQLIYYLDHASELLIERPQIRGLSQTLFIVGSSSMRNNSFDINDCAISFHVTLVPWATKLKHEGCLCTRLGTILYCCSTILTAKSMCSSEWHRHGVYGATSIIIVVCEHVMPFIALRVPPS